MTELRPFQIEGVQQIRRFQGRALLADEMGLGKTIQACDWVRRIKSCRPVVIVTPAFLKWNWQSEFHLHFGMTAHVLDGRRKKHQRHLPGDIVLVNYEILESWLPVLLKAKPQCVVFDEAHYVKTFEAVRTQASIKLAHSASVRSVLVITGTPMTNRPYELWSLLHIVRPDLFPDRSKFAWRYCKPRYTFRGWVYDGASNVKELNRILTEEVMIRRLTRDVAKDIPDKLRIYVSLHLPEKEMAEYREAEEDFLNWLAVRSPARAARAKKSPALAKVGYLMRLAAKMKRRLITQWIENFFEEHPGEKLVAMTMHRPAIDYQKKKFPKALIIDGRVTGKLRHETVRAFQSNRRIDLSLCNWLAAGVGVTLHAAATFLGMDLPWTPGHLIQGEKRIHRIGQKNTCRIYYPILVGTIEEKVVRIHRRKAKVIDAILNGEEPDEDLTNIFAELLQEIKHGH